MKMKNSIIALIVVMLGSMFSVSAQSEYKTEMDLMQDAFGKSKKDFVTSLVEIPSDKNEMFWNLYNAYETSRKSLSETRIKLMNQYVASYNSNDLDKKNINSVINQAMKIGAKNTKLINKYYKKLSSKISPKTAMQFFQVENYIRTAIDARIYENLPI